MKQSKRRDSDSDFNKYPNEPYPATSTTLIDKLWAKDEKAWERMKRLFSNLFLEWCRKDDRLQRADRQDIYQDVFLTAFKNIEQFRREGKRRGSFRAWLKTITRSRISDYTRNRQDDPALLSDTRLELYRDKLQVEPELPDFDEPLVETEEEIEQELTIIYHSALEMVRTESSERDWAVFTALTLNQKSIKAAVVAEEHGLSVDNARKIKSRITKRIKSEFGELLEERDRKSESPPSQ